MDEPLANLEAKLRVHMRTELQRLHKELDTTIIYVTHDQAEAMTMSDRIAVINAGKLQQIDPPLVCYNEPANLFVAGFIGSPSMNFIEGTITDNGFESEYVTVDFDPSTVGVTVGSSITLGIRPEDVYESSKAHTLADPTVAMPVTTDVLEPMGDEIFIYLLLSEAAETSMDTAQANDQLLMSTDPDSTLGEDEQLEVVLDRSKVHLFDTASGTAISHGIADPAVASESEAEPSTDD
jgi:multiple sugar transport system ATP-binding protein